MQLKTKAAVVGLAALAVAWSAFAQYGDGSECREARERASHSASELAGYARKLQRCAESGDLNYDCYSEFRRVKNAHSDYESAVSEVGSECD